MGTRELLAAARQRQGLPSNYALSKVLDVREKDVSRWNTGQNVPSDETILRLCELAQVDPAEWLPAIYAERAAGSAVSAVWRRVAERAKAAALAALVAVSGGALPSNSEARTGAGNASSGGAVYIMSNGRRRVRLADAPAPGGFRPRAA